MMLGAVIPAAGYSSRMGSFKPLMQLGERSIVAHCIHLFQSVGIERIVVVTGHRQQEVTAEVKRYGVQSLNNPAFDRGMFSSVCAAMPSMAGLDGFFMLPVDIPLVRPVTLEVLISAFDRNAVTYPCRNGMRGHPPLIPGQLIGAIEGHDGNGGLKSLLEHFAGKDVEVWDDGVLMDADTPDDYACLARRFSKLATGSRSEAETLAAMVMPERGVAHGREVAAIACTLAEELNRNGYSLDLDVVYNGALLHDVAKGLSDHEARGAEMMKRFGLDRLADVVGGHRDALPMPAGAFSEKELVCLADKLVRGTRRMPVHQRFEEKLVLYAHDRAACRAIQLRLNNALALQQIVENVTSRTLDDILGMERVE